MLVLTKKPTTDGCADIHIRGVPLDKADAVSEAIEKVLALAELAIRDGAEDESRTYSIEEVFPDFGPGDALKGARSMAGLTQARLAEMAGIRASHISGMETGKRPIGKEMAKRLARVLKTSYKVFL